MTASIDLNNNGHDSIFIFIWTCLESQTSSIVGLVRLFASELIALGCPNFSTRLIMELSLMNIYVTSWPVLIKFYMEHHWDRDKGALWF